MIRVLMRKSRVEPPVFIVVLYQYGAVEPNSGKHVTSAREVLLLRKMSFPGWDGQSSSYRVIFTVAVPSCTFLNCLHVVQEKANNALERSSYAFWQ